MFAFSLTLAFISVVGRSCGGRGGILIERVTGFIEIEVEFVIKMEIVRWCQQRYRLIFRQETWGFDGRREFPTWARKFCGGLGGRSLHNLLFFRCPGEVRREPEKNVSFLRWVNNSIYCVEFLERRAIREVHHRFA